MSTPKLLRAARWIPLLALLGLSTPLVGCDDADQSSKRSKKRKAKKAKKAAKKKAPKRSLADEPETKIIPRLGLTVLVAPDIKVTAGKRPGTGAISIPKFANSVMTIRTATEEDLTFESFHQMVQDDSLKVFEKELLKEVEGKAFTYVYAANLFGKKKVVYHQTRLHNGKAWVCASNAESEEAAKAFKAVCDSIGKDQ